MASYTSTPMVVPAHAGTADFRRADLTFSGVDHSGSSFEARVFLNNASATESTQRTEDQGYVGAFHVFGHGGCFGEAGHCDIRQPVSMFDRRLPHQLTPTTKTVIVTKALRRLVGDRSKDVSVTVTLVPIVRRSALAVPEDAESVLMFSRIELLTYD
jgi:hypothetical protein